MSKFVQLWALCHGFFIKAVKGCSPLIFTALYKQFKGECLAVIHLSPSHTYNRKSVTHCLHGLTPLFYPHCRRHVHGNFWRNMCFISTAWLLRLLYLADEHNLVFEPAPRWVFFFSHKFKMGFHHVFFVASRNLQEPVPPRWVFWSSLSSTD